MGLPGGRRDITQGVRAVAQHQHGHRRCVHSMRLTSWVAGDSFQCVYLARRQGMYTHTVPSSAEY